MKKFLQRRFDESTRRARACNLCFGKAIKDIQRFSTRNQAMKLSSRPLWGDMLSCKETKSQLRKQPPETSEGRL